MGADRHIVEELDVALADIPPDVRQPSQIELLLRTVESELIPRLFVSHMMEIPVTSPLVENRNTEPTPGPWCSEDAIESFARLCIGNDPIKLDQHVTDLLAKGVTLESVFLYLLTPVARHLGDCWLEDSLSFVDVHLGLCRLHQLVCECEAIGYRAESVQAIDKSILLSSTPGEDHTFGVTMVADFFRRYGWRVSNLCGLGSDFVLTRISSTEYSAVGFSLHGDHNYDQLAAMIAEVKKKTINTELLIMVGGDFFNRHPHMVEKAGADIFASDGRQAVLLANNACLRNTLGA